MTGMKRGKARAAGRGRVTKQSGRYTPATPRSDKVSPPWVPAFMLTALVCGAVVVMTGYFGLRPGATQLLVLLVGGVLVAAGLIAATRYR